MSLVLFLVRGAHALQWPFDPVSVPPNIANAFGDWAVGRLHPGIDMPRPAGTAVKAIEGGCVVKSFSFQPGSADEDKGLVFIAPICSSPQGWGYVHLRNVTVSVGATVVAGQIIGEVALFDVGNDPNLGANNDHLHLGRFRPTPDFIDVVPQNPLNYYTGSLPDQVALLDENLIYFVPDKTFLPGKFPLLPSGERVVYEDVDIIAEAHNKIVNETRAGAFSISFDIRQPPMNATRIARRTLGRFFEVPSASAKYGLVYTAGANNPSGNFHGHYVLTNCGISTPTVSDGTANVLENAWFTRVRADVDDSAGGIASSQKARANIEARYGDGRYAAGLRVGTYNDSHTVDRERHIVVDNFRPFVSKVTIEQGAKYSKAWLFDDASGNFTSTGPAVAHPIGKGVHEISVFFSEPVENPILEIDTMAGPITLNSSEPVGDRRTYSGTFNAGGPAAMREGRSALAITAKDSAGNSLLAMGPGISVIDSATQLARGPDGKIQGVGGPDTSVIIFADFTLPVITMTDGEGQDLPALGTTAAGSISVGGNDLAKDGTPGSGVAFITLTQTSGTYRESQPFSGPPFDVSQTVTFPLPDGPFAGNLLPQGIYAANVVDAAGNSSTATFTISSRFIVILDDKGKVVPEGRFTKSPSFTCIGPATAAQFRVDSLHDSQTRLQLSPLPRTVSSVRAFISSLPEGQFAAQDTDSSGLLIASQTFSVDRTAPNAFIRDEQGQDILTFARTDFISVFAADPLGPSGSPSAALSSFTLTQVTGGSFKQASAAFEGVQAGTVTFPIFDLQSPNTAAMLAEGLHRLEVADQVANIFMTDILIDRSRPKVKLYAGPDQLIFSSDEDPQPVISTASRLTAVGDDGPIGAGISTITLIQVDGALRDSSRFEGLRTASATFPLEGAQLEEGNYLLTVIDQVGNKTEIDVIIDRTPPEVQVRDEVGQTIASEGGYTASPRLTVSALDRISGLARLEVFKNGNTLLGTNEEFYQGPHVYTGADGGLSTLDSVPEGFLGIFVHDKAGNFRRVAFPVDRTGPLLTVFGGHPQDPLAKVGPGTGVINNLSQAPWLHNQVLEGDQLTGVDVSAEDGGTGVARVFLGKPNFDPALATWDQPYPEWTARADISLLEMEDEKIFGVTTADHLGNATTAFFRLDSLPPLVSYQMVVSADLSSARAVGNATDMASGIRQVILRPMAEGTTIFGRSANPRPGPNEESFDFTIPQDPALLDVQIINAGDVSGLINDANPIWVAGFRFGPAAGRTLRGLEAKFNTGWFPADDPYFGSGRIYLGAFANVLQEILPRASCQENGCAAAGTCGVTSCGSVTLSVRTSAAPTPNAPPGSVGLVNEGVNFSVDGTVVHTALALVNPPADEIKPIGLPLSRRVDFRLDVSSAPGWNVLFNFGYDIMGLDGYAVSSFPMVRLPEGPSVEVCLAEGCVKIGRVHPGPNNRIGILAGVPVVPPEGFSGLPASPPHNVGVDILTMASYDGPVRVTLPYNTSLSEEAQSQIRMYHLENGAWRDVTASVDTAADKVVGTVQSLSIFALFVPVSALPRDQTPPTSSLSLDGSSFTAPGGQVYISTRTKVVLAAADAESGVDGIYYAVDPSTDLLAAGLSSATAAAFTRYGGPFTLAEGVRRLAYGVVDLEGNVEPLKTEELRVDGTIPQASFTVLGSSSTDGNFLVLSAGTSVALSAEDPVSNGVAAGLQGIFYLVDRSPEDCGPGEPDPDQPSGTCQNPIYSGPFTLTAGTHTVRFVAIDKVENGSEDVHSRLVKVQVEAAPACAPLPSGAVGWWDGDRVVEGLSVDLASDNDAALRGGLSLSAGKVGQAFSFDGIDDTLRAGAFTALDGRGAATFEFWTKVRALSSGGGCNSGSCDSVFFGLNNETLYLALDAALKVELGRGTGSSWGSPSYTTSDAALTGLGEWNHVAVTVNSTEDRFYINGALSGVRQRSVGSFPTLGGLILGAGFNAGYLFLDGWLDEVTIYDRALGPEEIAAVHAAGDSGKCKPGDLRRPTLTLSVQGEETLRPSLSASFRDEFSGINTASLNLRIDGQDYTPQAVASSTGAVLSLSADLAPGPHVFTASVADLAGNVSVSSAAFLAGAPAFCVDSPPGTVAWWDGDAVSGGRLLDQAGAQDGTMANGLSQAPGKVGRALSFDGIDDLVRVASFPALDGKSAASFEFWVQVKNFASGGGCNTGSCDAVLFGRQDQTLSVAVDSNLRIEVARGDGQTWGNPAATLSDGRLTGLGRWNHVAVVVDGTHDRVFINGTLVSDKEQTESVIPALGGMMIGAGFTGGYLFLDGLLDELQIYDRALTAQEVARVHAAGAAGKCKRRAESQDGVAVLTAASGELAVSTAAAAGSGALTAAVSGTLAPLTTVFYELDAGAGGLDGTATLRLVFDPGGADLSQVAIYRFDGTAWSSAAVTGQTVTLLADGLVEISGRLASTSLYAVFRKLDTQPPVTTLSVGAPSAQDGAGLVVSPRTPLSLSARDPDISSGTPGSGVQSIRFALNGGAYAVYQSSFNLGAGTHTLAFFALDHAGNQEAASTRSLTSDGSSPRVLIASPLGGERFLAGGGSITADFSVSDDRDPAPSRNALLVQLEDRGSPRGARLALIPLPSTRTFAPIELDDGLWELRVSAVDWVGNSTAAASGAFEVIHDTLPPRTSLVVPPNPGPASPIAFTAQDDLLEIGDGIGLGVERTLYALDGGSFTVVAGTFTITADGAHLVAFKSVDRAGNEEAVRTATVTVDALAPALRLNLPEQGGVCSVFKEALTVRGGVFDANLAYYSLQAGTAVLSSGTRSVDGVLGTWDLGALAGNQTLTLTASDLAGNAAILSRTVFAGEPARTLVLQGNKEWAQPQAVAADAARGLVYAANTNKGEVRVYDAAGAFLKAIPDLSHPRAVAVDEDGNLYIAESGKDRIVKLGPLGNLLWRKGGSGRRPLEFRDPSGIAAKGGKVAISDTRNRRVQILDADGNFLKEFPIPEGTETLVADDGDQDDEPENRKGVPVGIALDGQGRIYVADAKGRRGLEFDPQGALLKEYGGPATFARPEGIAVSASGECVFMSDRIKDRITKFDGEGRIALTFGTQGNISGKRTLPVESVFRRPIGLDLDPAGSLWVADRNNEAIQRFGLPGALTAGSPAGSAIRVTDEDEPRESSSSAPSGAGEFYLRQVYAVPNPCKGCGSQGFVVQVGLADSVNLECRNVMGRVVYQSAFPSPTFKDIGNGRGPQYTYETHWPLSGVGTGVYACTVTARKAGKAEIRKIIRTAIIR